MSPEGRKILDDFHNELDQITIRNTRKALPDKFTTPNDAELSDNAILILNGFIKSACLTDDEKVVAELAVYKRSRSSAEKSKYLSKILKVQEATNFVLGFRNSFMKNSNRARNLLTDNALHLWFEYKNRNK